MCRMGAMLMVTALVAAGGVAAQEDSKRAPKGFLGMRGKKDDDVFDKRAPILGFQGVRGKKDDVADLQELDSLDKRAPILGFQGVRGKKDEDEAYDKRAPILGFQGVRGKKDGEEVDEMEVGDYLQQVAGFPYQEQDYVEDGDGYEGLVADRWPSDDKRAPKGFFGMRGKKAPLAGFYGVRGKKGPSGFYGVRGKKAPQVGFYGVRGKKAPVLGFQGVRGKKYDADAATQQDLDSLLYYLSDSSAAARQKRGNSQTAPSGFIGTRGKKAWLPQLDGEEVQASDKVAAAPVNIQ